ncbi:MAG: GNAT family N-acetyltransferase [Oscillospiraceae bacterium]|nr:GNAT family N-acetyltransferase [Oscillospiraceae bacterium]
MTEPLFREYTPGDIPALTVLWTDVFGDTAEIVTCFFRVLPEIGSCFVAECNGEIAGMASVLTDQRYVNGESCVPCAYIYAVAVDLRYRGAGIGAKLSRMAEEYGREHGAEIIATLPAEDGLYAMYEKTLGLKKTLRHRKIFAVADHTAEAFPLTPASPAAYNAKREELLAALPHVSVSDESIEYLKTLCKENEGDIYVSDTCCAACYVNHKEVFFTELLCSDEERKRLLAGGAAFKNAAGAFCFIPCNDGEKSLAYDGGELEPDTVWNSTFG